MNLTAQQQQASATNQVTSRGCTTQPQSPRKGPMSKGTPNRTIRIPEPRWQAAKKRADVEGTTITQKVNEYLETYGTQQQQTN